MSKNPFLSLELASFISDVSRDDPSGRYADKIATKINRKYRKKYLHTYETSILKAQKRGLDQGRWMEVSKDTRNSIKWDKRKEKALAIVSLGVSAVIKSFSGK